MSDAVSKLKEAAKCAPLWADTMNAAADELESKRKRLAIAVEALQEIRMKGRFNNGAGVVADAALIRISRVDHE